MAVYRNYYRRKPLGSAHKWAITFPCLYLLCSTMTVVSGERLRHHRAEDVYVSQLERSAVEESSKTPVVTCPNCLYKNGREVKAETDNLRLEAIKRQILSKLGLRHKPNVTHSLPREVIMETLSRAEDNSDFFRNSNSEENISTTSVRTSTVDAMDFDDFYGRTSEIISFAEQDGD
ncbi:TGFb propeptide domain containing protein [Asbolus verrucosus]|uniref:TGFb propeptide domain containing protein n=1 Tax=Asbolus verrucosus TaxID=1661398 RepID=A0A482W803_ASBVE|nr:TGFb propeptide domain containing protein [Asbolus verrucosus]